MQNIPKNHSHSSVEKIWQSNEQQKEKYEKTINNKHRKLDDEQHEPQQKPAMITGVSKGNADHGLSLHVVFFGNLKNQIWEPLKY